jgi:PKD repeat protein
LDNIGQLDFPHSISKLFRVGDELYGFITNVRNNTITRLQFSGCNNSSLKSSNEKDPPPITFDKVGTYQINLTTDEGLPSQSSYCRQVVVIPEPFHTPLQTFTIKPGEKIKIGTGNASRGFKWNTGATTDSIVAQSEGLYWVETTGYGCSNIDSFFVRYLNTGDFSYNQDACNPLQFEFKNITVGSTVLNWDFGNGPLEAGKPDPIITYNSLGNYNVTLNLKSTEGDMLSVTKQIAVQVLNDSLIISNDKIICENKNLQLDAIPALSYCWTPATGLSATDIKNPLATPSINTTYFLHSLVAGQNLITNGDFSNGNNSFLSDYQYSLKNTIPAQYFIGASPVAWNNQFNNCTDHSSGSGNMMIVKSSSVEDKEVWSQTINVLPNTNYSFSTWVQSLSSANNIQLQLAINGNIIGTISKSIPSCTWKQFYSTWNSGNKTNITLSIINQNTLTLTDFALDDIAFAEVFMKRDSVKISIEKASVQINNDTTVCWGATVQLKATGANSYSWTPTANVENPGTGITSAKIYQDTKFFVTGTTKNGCTATGSINFFIHSKPLITKTADTLICPNSKVQLHIDGGISYSWSPTASLDDASIASPTAAPVSDTKYFVNVIGDFACEYKDSILVSIKPPPDFSITPSTKICIGDSIRLFADGGDQYNWTPVTVMNDPTLHNPIVFPERDTEFKVSIKESLCNIAKELSTMVYVFSKPLITASKTNDIDCSFGTTHLTATGGTSYQWSGTALSNPNIYNPTAKPTTTTTYIVTAKDFNGCTNEDSVTVNVDYTNKGENYIYSAFTPNNDGLNDCFGISHRGDGVFFTTNSNICWDGKYKSVPQVAGIYVYQVKGKTACTNINLKGTFVLIR